MCSSSFRRPLRWLPILWTSLAVLLLAAAARGMAPREEIYELSAKDMGGGARIDLLEGWLFHAGDEPAFASPGLDDSDWTKVDSRLRSGEIPADWDGVGWFRLRLRVEPRLRGDALGLLLDQSGAAEVYLDGELLFAVGAVDEDPEKAVPRIQRRPHVFAFDGREIHLLAVRYGNHDAGTLAAAGKHGGFVASLAEANLSVAAYALDLGTLSASQAFFTGVLGAVALLHLLLFAFYREAAENLFFALLTGAVALLVYLFLESSFTTDPRRFGIYDRGINLAWLALSIFAPRFVFSVFEPRLPRRYLLALAAAAALVVPAWVRPLDARPFIFIFLLLASVEMARTVVAAILRRAPGAQIIGFGILALVAGIAVGLLASFAVLPESILTAFYVPFGSVLLMILTMSVYLSRSFARTQSELRLRLEQVQELSQQKLEQERRARREEVERKLLEAKYRHKVEELEEARKLQLSMLPDRLPQLPDLEIAAGMFTATEVGGDYYDFDLADDGTLTIAVGDATGHGMKAGAVVTATKSLFHAMGEETDLPLTLSRFGRALQRMNLHQLNMALMLARFKAGKLCLAAAGMPPALVYRAATGTVESVETEGLPLGTFAGFPYQQRNLDLGPGDTVLMMSDGFPERLNADHEMLGYDNVSKAFYRAAAGSSSGPAQPETVIERLVADGEAWAGGQPPADDTTFVVLKVRHQAAAVPPSAAP